ncbi:MAG: ABC transporter substrate binding protein, partial [Patescibacteria group bacterium]
MKKIIFVILVVVVGGAIFFIFNQNQKNTKQENIRTYKIGLIYQGDSFESVVNGFKEELDLIAKSVSGRVIEYVAKRVESSNQVDFDIAAKDLVDQKVDLIFATSVEPIVAAKKATEVNKIPVVLALGGNPVSIGLVESTQKPGNNLTGMTWLAWELSGKRLELLLKIDPRIKRIIV